MIRKFYFTYISKYNSAHNQFSCETHFYIHFDWIKIEHVCSKYNDTILCYVSILHENNKNVPKLALLAMTWALQLRFR